MTTFVPPSSFLTSQGPRTTSSALIQQPRRRVTLTNRYGNQRRPLPTPVASVAAQPATHKKKSVRFCSDNDLEHVRLFLKTQTPLAAAHDPLPPPKRWEISYPGWPSKWAMYKSFASPTTTAVKMEQVILANNNSVLKGRCRVANLAYEKQVVVRYSFDHWQTSQEQTAVFHEPIIANAQWDRFTFEIPAPIDSNTTALTCSMALRYQVNDQMFWDNNDGHDYQVKLTSSVPTIVPGEDESHDYFSYGSLQLKPRSPAGALHTGYDDFISKYCFYNSSILQN